MSDTTAPTEHIEGSEPVDNAPIDWEAVSRNPLRSVSVHEIELAIAMALQSLAPRDDHEYKVSIDSLEFSKAAGFLDKAVSLQLTVRNERPIGDLFGGDIFGKRNT